VKKGGDGKCSSLEEVIKVKRYGVEGAQIKMEKLKKVQKQKGLKKKFLRHIEKSVPTMREPKRKGGPFSGPRC